jgi:hypothetical protein
MCVAGFTFLEQNDIICFGLFSRGRQRESLAFDSEGFLPSGTVTIFILPIEAPLEVPCRMGLGYEMWAVDPNGQEVTSFAGTITIEQPLPTRATLEAWGLPPEASLDVIVFMFYSTLVDAWVYDPEDTEIDEGDMEVTLTLRHF